jgi:hypothetical protein
MINILSGQLRESFNGRTIGGSDAFYDLEQCCKNSDSDIVPTTGSIKPVRQVDS